jgi:hypothetical protein
MASLLMNTFGVKELKEFHQTELSNQISAYGNGTLQNWRLIWINVLSIKFKSNVTTQHDWFVIQNILGQSEDTSKSFKIKAYNYVVKYWFMVAILNQEWPPKYKNPPIWGKFGFQHESQKLGSNYFLLCSHTILHDPLYGLNLTFFAPWLPWQRLHFECFQPPKAATHYGGYSYKVS